MSAGHCLTDFAVKLSKVSAFVRITDCDSRVCDTVYMSDLFDCF